MPLVGSTSFYSSSGLDCTETSSQNPKRVDVRYVVAAGIICSDSLQALFARPRVAHLRKEGNFRNAVDSQDITVVVYAPGNAKLCIRRLGMRTGTYEPHYW